MLLRFQQVVISCLCLLLVLLASCGNKGEEAAADAEIAELDSTIHAMHAVIDTGYKNNYEYLNGILTALEKKCEQAGYNIGLARIYLMRGSMERWRQNYSEGLEWCKKAYDKAKDTDTKTETDILLETGDIYKELNKKRLANEYFLMAYEIADKLEDKTVKAFVASRLGVIFYQQRNYPLSLETNKKALSYLKEVNFKGEHETKHLQLYNNIALCYVQMGHFDSARSYYDSALLEGQKLKGSIKQVASGVVYGNMGRLYQLKGDYPAAVEYLKRNITVNSKPRNDNGDAVTSLTYLLEIYLELDSNRRFEENVDQAVKFTYTVNRNDMRAWRARLMDLQARQSAKTGNYTDAYKYLVQKTSLQDTINNLEVTEDLKDLILYRQLNEQTDKVKKLEEDRKKQDTRMQNLLLAGGIVVIVFTATILGLYGYRRSLKKAKNLNDQIAKQNKLINSNRIKLESAIDELKVLNAEKNRLLGMVAHDLRGPIYNITGVLQLLDNSEGFAKLDESDKQLVELIKKSCDNALDVINDLLDAAQLDNASGPKDLEKEPVNLADLVRNTINMYDNRAQHKNIQVQFNEPEEPVIAFVSGEKLSRAIGNLLSNAIKFSHSDSKVTVGLSSTVDTAVISVSDVGVGIPREDFEAIFDKFTKAKRHGTLGEKPVGLGMSIVKQIVDAHNGRVWFESRENEGTTFYLELPVK